MGPWKWSLHAIYIPWYIPVE